MIIESSYCKIGGELMRFGERRRRGKRVALGAGVLAVCVWCWLGVDQMALSGTTTLGHNSINNAGVSTTYTTPAPVTMTVGVTTSVTTPEDAPATPIARPAL
jgi:hypothetical protein